MHAKQMNTYEKLKSLREKTKVFNDAYYDLQEFLKLLGSNYTQMTASTALEESSQFIQKLTLAYGEEKFEEGSK